MTSAPACTPRLPPTAARLVAGPRALPSRILSASTPTEDDDDDEDDEDEVDEEDEDEDVELWRSHAPSGEGCVRCVWRYRYHFSRACMEIADLFQRVALDNPNASHVRSARAVVTYACLCRFLFFFFFFFLCFESFRRCFFFLCFFSSFFFRLWLRLLSRSPPLSLLRLVSACT